MRYLVGKLGMRRTGCYVLTALMASIGLAAGGGSTAIASSSGPVHIVFLEHDIADYSTAMLNAMQTTAKADGATVTRFNANFDPSVQETQCQDAITSHQYNAIMIYAVDSEAAAPCVRQAAAAHIPVVNVDNALGPNPNSSAIQVSGIKAQITGGFGSIDVNGTVALVKQACSHFAKPCTIVVTEAVPAFTYCSYKIAHEIPIFKHLGYDVLGTPVIGNFDDPDGVKSAIQNELVKAKTIDVIVSDDDSSVLGAVEMKQQGKLPKTLIIGDGGSTGAIRLIKAGSQFGTLFTDPATEGRDAVNFAVKLVRGQPIGKRNLTILNTVPAGKYEVTKSNVGGVVAQW